MVTSALTDAALVRRALEGDKGAQRELRQRLQPTMERWARRALSAFRIAEPASVADAVQQAWLELFDARAPKLAEWQPNGMRLDSFAAQRARWAARAIARERLAQKRGAGEVISAEGVEDVPGDDDPERRAVASDLAEKLRLHLWARLPDKGRLVFTVLYVDQLTPDEAAEQLGVSRQVIYNWQFKIRALARELVSGE